MKSNQLLNIYLLIFLRTGMQRQWKKLSGTQIFFMFVASGGLYSFNTHYYVCSLIQPASFYTHIYYISFQFLFDIASLYLCSTHSLSAYVYTYKIQRHSIFRVPTAGFDPPKRREDCYQSTTLPPSHHGWIPPPPTKKNCLFLVVSHFFYFHLLMLFQVVSLKKSRFLELTFIFGTDQCSIR